MARDDDADLLDDAHRHEQPPRRRARAAQSRPCLGRCAPRARAAHREGRVHAAKRKRLVDRRGLDRGVRLVDARARRGDSRGFDAVDRLPLRIGGRTRAGRQCAGCQRQNADERDASRTAGRERWRGSSESSCSCRVGQCNTCATTRRARSRARCAARARVTDAAGNASPTRALRAARICRSMRPAAGTTAARRRFAELARSLLESPRRRALCTQDSQR